MVVSSVFASVVMCARFTAVILLAAMSALLSGQAIAQSETSIVLDGTTPVRDMAGKVFTIADPDREFTLADIKERYAAGQLEVRSQRFMDFGYTETRHWIAVPFENASEVTVTYLLSSNWPVVDDFHAWVSLPPNDDLQIVEKDMYSPAGQIDFSGTAITSEQFLVPPLVEGVIYIRFTPFAFGIFPASLETPASAYERAVVNSIGFAAFYGAMSAAAFIFMLFVIAIRHAGGIYFMGIIVSGLLIIASLDGFLFQYLWPQWPVWNRSAPFNLMAFVNVTSFALARYMFGSANRQKLARWSGWFIFASLFPHLVWLTGGLFWAIAVGYVFLILAMAALTYAIVIWTQMLPRKRQFAFFSSIIMLIAVGWILSQLALGTGAVHVASHTLIKLLYVIMVVSSMVAYATHIAALNRDYADSLRRELELARKDARMNAELLQSERKFAEAQELVARHKHRLATTSHDLKQPIASLRLTLDAMAKSGGKKVEANVARAFDYLEDLVNENLQEGRLEPAENSDQPEENVELDLVFETIRQMFAEEAVSKGIRLDVQPSGLSLQTEIVPLMRVVSNLVSNAVKHTTEGAVTLSAHEQPAGELRDGQADTIAITVADTGPGMSDEEISRYSQIGEKGEKSTGSGYGLAICLDLARQMDMSLAVHSEKGKGTRCILTTPARKPA